jgi:hypothetical protein
MFHEVLDDLSDISGFHQESNGKYTISLSEFKRIISLYGKDTIYTFDDGGKSNLIVANILKKHGICGIFCIPTAFIGKQGFLSKSDICKLSESHIVIPHGHDHIMSKHSFDILYKEWAESILKIQGITNKTVNCVCLPGGTFSRIHSSVFSELNIKTIYHSASSNLILNILYNKNFDFVPRIVIAPSSSWIMKLFTSFKSHIKQIIYY